MDAVQASSSGHLGLPLGAADMGAVLFGHALNFYPDDPLWLPHGEGARKREDGALTSNAVYRRLIADARRARL